MQLVFVWLLCTLLPLGELEVRCLKFFWFSHHLFIPFFLLICVHGLEGILGPPDFWKWVLGPGFLYFVERLLRVFRGNQETILIKVIQHPSRVIELQMRKTEFDYTPGQYLFLQCPWIGGYEWHPFTITSCPEEDFVSVHIRSAGDWTNALAKFLNPENRLGVVQEDISSAPDGNPILKIDGPFGAAAEEAFQYQAIMLIGAGIGVTPYASILKSMMYKNKGVEGPIIRKVYFYWISPDKSAFEWFSDLLKALEGENNGFLQINIFLTGALSPDEIRTIMHGDGEEDQVTGLASRTNFGRPKWNDIFLEKINQHPDEDVGVFFCGPQALSRSLYKNCVKYTKESTTKFHYRKENF